MFGEWGDGAEDVVGEHWPVANEGREKSAPGGGVVAEDFDLGGERAFESDSGAVVERVGEWGGGMKPFEAVFFERQGEKEGRACAEWMDGGAEVVMEAGEGEVEGACCAAGDGLGLVDGDFEACLGEDDGGGETVGACTDDIRSLTSAFSQFPWPF